MFPEITLELLGVFVYNPTLGFMLAVERGQTHELTSIGRDSIILAMQDRFGASPAVVRQASRTLFDKDLTGYSPAQVGEIDYYLGVKRGLVISRRTIGRHNGRVEERAPRLKGEMLLKINRETGWEDEESRGKEGKLWERLQEAKLLLYDRECSGIDLSPALEAQAINGLAARAILAEVYEWTIRVNAVRFDILWGLGWLRDDLVNEGRIGLLLAIGSFDPDRGVNFSSYARFWVEKMMRGFLAEEFGKRPQMADISFDTAPERPLSDEFGPILLHEVVADGRINVEDTAVTRVDILADIAPYLETMKALPFRERCYLWLMEVEGFSGTQAAEVMKGIEEKLLNIFDGMKKEEERELLKRLNISFQALTQMRLRNKGACNEYNEKVSRQTPSKALSCALNTLRASVSA